MPVEDLAIFLWLQQYVKPNETPAAVADEQGAMETDIMDMDGRLSGEAAAQAFDDLDAKRREWMQDAPIADDFRTSIRGRAWVAAREGVAVDSARAAAAGGEPAAWCTRYGLQTTST